MRTIHRVIVSGLIFSKDNKLLMGKKDPKKGGVYVNCWHIPGGGVNEGEDLKQALIREIKEEVSIDISRFKIQMVDDKGKGKSEKILETGEKVFVEMNFNVFKIMILDKNSSEINVKLNDDLVKYKWFDLAEIPLAKLTPPSVILYKHLGYLH